MVQPSRKEAKEGKARTEPELRVPLGRRIEALGAFVEELARGGAGFVRLDEASRERGLIA